MSPAPRHRHAVDGGYPRGEETRARIVMAALALFGERGFDGASTRDIAERAGVNAPAIGYYFDNKEGVYLACVQHIVSRVWEHVLEPVEAAEAALKNNADDEALIEAFCAIQAAIATFMFTSTETENWRLFMAREHAGLGPKSGFEMIDEKLSCRLRGVSATIVGRLLGRPADEEETLIRTMLLNGPIAAFHMHGRKSLQVLGWDAVKGDRLVTLLRLIKEQTVTIMHGMTANRRVKAVNGKRVQR
jgi:AcrR family transcriptional regulator